MLKKMIMLVLSAIMLVTMLTSCGSNVKTYEIEHNGHHYLIIDEKGEEDVKVYTMMGRD